uniref:Heat shock factor binding protein 1 n=1 Tax=Strigamia maritima TaxID=126957 RepID=T1JHR1_STRMM
MADSKQGDIKTLSEPTKDFNNIAADPKNMQDLTQYVKNLLLVQALLQQMQDKFQTMSDQIIARNILLFTDLMTQAGIEEVEK